MQAWYTLKSTEINSQALGLKKRLKSFALKPVTCACHIFKQLAALSESRTCRCAERNNRFSCKIICFHKGINRPCGNSPPDRITDEHSVIFRPVLRCCRNKFNISCAFIFVLIVYTTALVLPVQIGIGISIFRL